MTLASPNCHHTHINVFGLWAVHLWWTQLMPRLHYITNSTYMGRRESDPLDDVADPHHGWPNQPNNTPMKTLHI